MDERQEWLNRQRQRWEPIPARPEQDIPAQCDGYAGDPGSSAPRCEGYAGHPGRHYIRPAALPPSAPAALDVTPERLADAMAVEGYADPDPIDQWRAPIEAARRILARLQEQDHD